MSLSWISLVLIQLDIGKCIVGMSIYKISLFFDPSYIPFSIFSEYVFVQFLFKLSNFVTISFHLALDILRKFSSLSMQKHFMALT